MKTKPYESRRLRLLIAPLPKPEPNGPKVRKRVRRRNPKGFWEEWDVRDARRSHYLSALWSAR